MCSQNLKLQHRLVRKCFWYPKVSWTNWISLNPTHTVVHFLRLQHLKNIAELLCYGPNEGLYRLIICNFYVLDRKIWSILLLSCMSDCVCLLSTFTCTITVENIDFLLAWFTNIALWNNTKVNVLVTLTLNFTLRISFWTLLPPGHSISQIYFETIYFLGSRFLMRVECRTRSFGPYYVQIHIDAHGQSANVWQNRQATSKSWLVWSILSIQIDFKMMYKSKQKSLYICYEWFSL